MTDIGCKFYIARFTNQDDYHHVLTQGPWMIEDNYLTIRKWVPNFIPDEAPIKVLTAWVRIPNLSVEYFDGNFLHKIGSKIGKVLRIDKTTSNVEKGQFTRLSVEIDLTKPLLSKFWLKVRIWKVQYEGLQLICFNCGCWGHSAHECPSRLNAEANMDQAAIPNNAQPVEAQPKARPELEQDFGDWMMIGLTSEIRGDGSRFSVLEGDNNDLPILEEVVEDVMEKPSYATVNLGESSQAPNLIKEPFLVGFNLGKDKISTPKKIVVAIKPIIPPVKQNSKSKPTRKQIFRVKDTNVTIQARSRVPSKPTLCKENSIPLIPATPRENSVTRNHAESNPMPTPIVHLPPLHASPSCHISSPPSRENTVCGQTDRKSVVSGGKPPDPQGGNCVPDLGGARNDAGTDSYDVGPQ
ncbi:uncharacterized protein LOC125494428 [Beta vulgaris subsp. vulgaris]|uniref:uncharacterized protein LOC125494428 n=1 Tax=Beta vulgaris subsp. vulgaris TaxID=3555 RepID=UPI00203704D2|nr:uncharacterized protein LOC125494428 [Beta vulgaris subsp. vulgaris]